MTDAAVPVTIAGKAYHIRYTYPDFKQMEMALGIGYLHFTRDEILKSLTAQEVYLWAGLKKEIPETGRWVHVFSQDADGREQVGVMLWEHLRQTGEIGSIINAVFEAFVTTGPWKRADPKKEPEREKKSPKNSKT